MSDNSQHPQKDLAKALVLVSRALVYTVTLFVLAAGIASLVRLLGYDNLKASYGRMFKEQAPQRPPANTKAVADTLWKAPDPGTADELVQYGRALVALTSKYLGPKGSVSATTNGMNCQNCHLDAGTRIFGNNYSAVASTYPKFRARSGTEESIEKRISDCFERSLNGTAPAPESKEMKAMVAYIRWVGKEVKKGKTPYGAGLVEVPYMDRAADPEKGKLAYTQKCVSCHGPDGAGQADAEGNGYVYPPLWGKHSYNHGAGLYRLSRFAGYVKANMPLGASHTASQLSDEEAWDIAAYVNSQPRPGKDLSKDWPDISKKPVDHPFGPYADNFSELQHKYGPFGPIKKAAKVKAQASSPKP